MFQLSLTLLLKDAVAHDVEKGTPVQVTLNINDKTLTYTTTEEFLQQQTIDPPTERMKLQWM